MRPSVHIATSAVLAAGLYAHSRSVPASLTCFLSGVLIDLDHLLDFHLFSGEQYTREAFFSWCIEDRWRKIMLLFHSYEAFVVLGMAAYFVDSAVLRGLFWGAALHLFLDAAGNTKAHRLSPWFYFMSFRIAAGFRKEKLIPGS